MMNSGQIQPTRPSLGSWLTYGLGTENQNLPGFVVLCPGKPVVGPQLWSNSFLPGIYQGTHINNKTIDPKSLIAHLTNRSQPRDPQRAQLDLLQQMNELHLAERPHDAQLEACLASPLTGAQGLPILFKRALDLHQMTFAMGESVAHLHLLWFAGQVKRELGKDGVYRFGAR
jgi:hypothetical protein